jgi:hypothetical protein
MSQTEEVGRRAVWVEEAMHRAANLRHLATNLERLLNNGDIDSSNGLRTIRRANALATAYRSRDEGCDFGLDSGSCARELRDIVGGLVEIFGHTKPRLRACANRASNVSDAVASVGFKAIFIAPLQSRYMTTARIIA